MDDTASDPLGFLIAIRTLADLAINGDADDEERLFSLDLLAKTARQYHRLAASKPKDPEG